MMVDIFSSFDSSIYFSVGGGFFNTSGFWWVVQFFLMNMFFVSYSCSVNRMWWVTTLPLILFHGEVGRSVGRQLGGFVNLVVSLFLMLMVTNLMGMIPYVFGVSAHICVSFIFGLPLWLSLILSSFSWNWYSSVSHFLPSGAPVPLIPFLVIIELVSTSVRPITLSARLAANLSAGHIVLGLMSVYLCKMIFSFSGAFFLLLMLEVGYFLFEVGVCMIQGYIFSLLVTLYADEHSL